MEIISKSITYINYTENRAIVKKTPESFDQYLSELISFIHDNQSVKLYTSKSDETTVVHNLNLLKNAVDRGELENIDSHMLNISQHLLKVEQAAQIRIEHLNIQLQKGSLIQAIFREETGEMRYLLAKVEHDEFVEDKYYESMTGFSKKKSSHWKSCIFELPDDMNLPSLARVYSNTGARFWWDDFLEVEEVTNDELNTIRSFTHVESILNRNAKKSHPTDYVYLRNSLIHYYRTNSHITYRKMISELFSDYKPETMNLKKLEELVEKMNDIPTDPEKKFETQFESKPDKLGKRTTSKYKVYEGIDLLVSEVNSEHYNIISSYEDTHDGIRYLRIRTNNDNLYDLYRPKETID